MNISQITVNGRHRSDLGDIAGLADSIKTLGLLHPVVVDGEGHLIAGERRLRACQSLGWQDVPATVATGIDSIMLALRAERDENTQRKDFLPSEAVSMARALEPFEKRAAEERMKAGRPSVNFTQGQNGRANDKVADAVGLSRPTLTKARAIIDAAESDPERFGDLPAKMDAGGKVAPVYKELAERAVAAPTKVTLPHAADVDTDDDDGGFPVPEGDPYAEIKTDPVLLFGKFLNKCYEVINGYEMHKTWKQIPKSHRKDCAKRLRVFAGFVNEMCDQIERGK